MSTVTLAFLGDVMLGRLVNEEIPNRPPESFWGTALPVLRQADGVFANLECAVTARTQPWSRTRKVFHFRAGPAAIQVLTAANVRCVGLANNHTLDFETEGLLDTLDHLDAVGIEHAGAGRNLREAKEPALVDLGGFKVGVIALTDNEPPFAGTADRPGTWYTEIGTDAKTLAPIEELATRLKDLGADLVVLSVHWGPNMIEAPPPRFRRFAQAVIERGVDLLHGHSAHIFQAVEPRGRRLILYDCGDFLDDYAVDPVLRNDRSFIFLVEADRRGPLRLRLLPVRLTFARVDLATGEEAEAIRARMRRLCEPFGTELEATDEGLELTL
jgi:poly-gamma-glutamate capsule biosynthesis protein CapA/YwtB (metallophosphatase superfamily)